MNTTDINRAYERANKFHALYCSSLVMDEPTSSIEKQYNKLVENYDFDNKIITDGEGHYGLALCTGKVVVAPIYDEVKTLTTFGIPTSDICIIARRDGHDYLVNHLGKELLEADEIRPSIGAISPVLFRQGSKWGMMSSSGRVIIAPEYDGIESDIYGIYWLERDGKKGFMDARRNVVEPCFDDIDANLEYCTNVIVDGEQKFLGDDYRPTDEPEDAIEIYTFQCNFE